MSLPKPTDLSEEYGSFGAIGGSKYLSDVNVLRRCSARLWASTDGSIEKVMAARKFRWVEAFAGKAFPNFENLVCCGVLVLIGPGSYWARVFS